ncbi:MAG: hypothetical protein HYZ44_03855 [Bacteroidetes bacterium]|nr:hypothetical protein [Bacteroidota bacterium]
MENRLDELFKNKLEHYASPPSGNAWQRVEGSLAKKNNSFAVWRIAAGVLLMAGSISALYWSQRSAVETIPNLSQRTTESSQQPEQKEQPTLKETVKPTTSIASAKSVSQKKNVTTPSVAMEKETESKVETVVQASSTKVEPTIEEVTPPLEMSTTTVVAQVPKTEKPIVLEFTLAPVQPEVTARVEEERNTGFKKLFTKARDLKNGESGLDLSDLTNKLFASNQKQSKDNIN